MRAHKLQQLIAPYFWDKMTDSSWSRLSADSGIYFGGARNGLGALLTGAVVLGVLCLAVCIFAGEHRRATAQQETSSISWLKLSILLGPFTAAYIAILALNTLQNSFFSRYLLPPLAFLLIVLACYYQEKVNAKLPWACILVIVPFAWFSLAATHDTFSLYQGYASAADEIRSGGTPATAIAGPWELQGWTQVEKAGHLNNPHIQFPKGAYVPLPLHAPWPNCSIDPATLNQMPAIEPAYLVSSDFGDCGGQTAFPPIMYRTWIAPHTNWIYALKLPPDFLQ